MKKRLTKLLRSTLKVVVFVGLCVAGWYAYTIYLPAEEEDDGLGSLPTAVAAVRDITVSVQATGVLQPIKVVEIKSKASGEILRMPVDVGDLVAAGDLIAQVDTDILDQEIKQVRADYDSAVVRLEIARSQYERSTSLHTEDLLSSDQLESSQQEYSNAEAQMLRNEAALVLAQERLADATVRAPARGTIIAKTVEEGQIIASSTNNVSGGTTLVLMADLSELQIRTLVDEVDIGQVRPGLTVESRVEAYADDRFDGEVIKIEPQAEIVQSVTSFPVLSRIDNSDGRLLPGMNADVSIIVHRKPGVLVIPNEAVRAVGDADTVTQMLGLADEMGGGASASEGFSSGAVGNRGGAPDAGRGAGGSDAAANGARGEREGMPAVGAGRGSDAFGGRGDDAAAGRGSEAFGGRGNDAAAGRGDGAVGGDRGTGPAAGDRGNSGGERGTTRETPGAGAGAADMRARFQNASAEERQRMIAEFRRAGGRGAAESDRDPFGIAGRREDAVVFLYDEMGRLTTANIVAGARDWEYTEILQGLNAGDEVLILPSTSLLQSQERFRNWARDRGGIPGIGGNTGRGSSGRRR